MRVDKNEAFTLRKQGKSYKKIHEELGMSVSTLSKWFKGVDFSESIRKELTKEASKKGSRHFKNLNRVRGETLKIHYELAEKEALEEMESLSKSPLFIAAIAAYWGEGDKASKSNIRIINTDPRMLRMFLIFLVDLCGVNPDKVSLAIFIYEDLDEDICKQYWSEQVGVNKFHKVQTLSGRHKTKRLPYGTGSIVVTNTYLKKKLIVWIDQLPKIVLNTVR